MKATILKVEDIHPVMGIHPVGIHHRERRQVQIFLLKGRRLRRYLFLPQAHLITLQSQQPRQHRPILGLMGILMENTLPDIGFLGTGRMEVQTPNRPVVAQVI